MIEVNCSSDELVEDLKNSNSTQENLNLTKEESNQAGSQNKVKKTEKGLEIPVEKVYSLQDYQIKPVEER